jgi:hypothetical protein
MRTCNADLQAFWKEDINSEEVVIQGLQHETLSIRVVHRKVLPISGRIKKPNLKIN